MCIRDSGYEGPGQGCAAIIRAQKQKTGEWKVTLANLNHLNCDGGNKANSTLSIEDIVASTVSINRRISTPALKKTNRDADGEEGFVAYRQPCSWRDAQQL